MDAQTVTAIVGVVGTLAAGLGGTYLGARLERKASIQEEEAEVRRAARLIDADLMFAETAARTCVENESGGSVIEGSQRKDGSNIGM